MNALGLWSDMKQQCRIAQLTPIERLYRLPIAPYGQIRMGSEGISYPVGSPSVPQHDLRIINSHEKFDELTRVRGPLRLRQLLGLSRREMAQELERYLGRRPSKQALIGWERRETKHLSRDDKTYHDIVEKYEPGKAAREAYWKIIESIRCEDGWRAVVDRRCTTYWRVTLEES
jgi:hypothetical protein